jgi:tetratricopeptide (TPR) repeat protein
MTIDSRFELGRKLGAGGMGEVYLARDTSTGCDVALKIASLGSRTSRDRFAREIEILSGINHDNIVRLICSGTDGDTLWYAMDYIAGNQLVEWFRDQEFFSFEQMTETMSRIASALDVIHSMGIVHRDVKPENFLVVDGKPVLVDFGVAHLKQGEQMTRLTREGSMVGTILYMSPEQVMGSQIDGRSDLYSLGAIMYEILTGKHPSEAPDLPRLIFKILQERPIRPTVINPDTPKDLERIVMKLMEKNPDLRFKSASDLEHTLLQFAGGESVQRSKHQSPMRSLAKREIPLVGRSQELNKLSLLLHSARAGQGQVVSVAGLKGFGKSRLIEEFRLVALGELSKFLVCMPQPEDSSRPAISSMLDQLADYEISCDVELLKQHPHMIQSLSPRLADSIGLQKDPPNIQDGSEIPSIISELLASSFPEIPSIFAFENDIDDLTISIALKLAKKSIDKKIVVCLAVEKTIPTKEWSELPNYSDIKLKPFGSGQINKIAESILGRELSELELGKVEENTDGNPHLVIQLISSMRAESKTISLTSMPVDIDSIYRDRVAKLSPNAKGLLELLSLMKRPVPSALLQPLARLSGTVFQEGFDDLEQLDLITEKNVGRELEVQIASDKLRGIVDSTLDGDESKGLHRVIASTLEIFYSDTEDADILATIGKHYLSARDYKKASEFILKSYANLKDNGRSHDAFNVIKLIENHLDDIDDVRVRMNILNNLIFIYPEMGDMNTFEKLKDTMINIIENNNLERSGIVSIYSSIAHAYSKHHLLPKADMYLEKGNKYLEFASDPIKLRFLKIKMNILVYQDRTSELPDLLETTKILLKKMKAPELDWISYYTNRGIYQSEMKNHVLAIEEFDRSLTFSKKINHKRQELRALSNLATAYRKAELFDKSIHYYEQALTSATKQGLLNLQALIINNMTEIHFFLGDVKHAKSSLAKFVEISANTPVSFSHLGWLSWYLHLRCLEGYYSEVHNIIDDYKDNILESNQTAWMRMLVDKEAYLNYYKGDYKRARLLFEQLVYLYQIDSKEDNLVPLYQVCVHLVPVYIREGNISSAEEYLAKAKSIHKKYNEDGMPEYLMLAEAELLFSKSIRTTTFGLKEIFDANAWRTSYNLVIKLLKHTEHKRSTIAMVPTYSTILFVKLVILRMKHDKKLDSIEKRQIFDQAIRRIEWLLKRYQESNFTHLKDEIIELNNELILQMD